MSSPEPIEDPYLALGVAKDADISAIRSAHRKLVLKYHPDRIKDEAERIKGKDAFPKVQQAYELLSDPTRRSRYDDRVKLAQLKKEAMAREPTVRMGTYPTRPAPPPMATPTREYRDGRFYEERVPSSSYFDEGYRYREEAFREEESRTTSRKYDDYERRSSIGREKEKKTTKWPEKVANDLPYNIAMKLKAKAAKTRENTVQREKTRERETHASSAKSRDKDQRRERMDKETSRKPYVVDASSSESDDDTFVSINRRSGRSSKDEYDSPRTKSRPEAVRSKTSSRYDEDDEDKWQSHHGDARDYIQRSQKPGLPRTSSAQSAYWDASDDRHPGKKSGSDSDRRPKSSKARRPSIDIQKVRPPAMPSRNSAPVGVATMKASLDRDDPRGKQRSSTGGSSPRGKESKMPQMSRSQTMPTSKSTRKGDAVPIRGSNLKHAETHDSGYGSSGGQTPDLSGTSPPRPSHKPTRYQIVEDEDDDVQTILVDPEDRHRRMRSPSPPARERDRRDRPQRPTISTNDRGKSSRGASYMHSPVETEPTRPSSYRQDSARSGGPRSGSPRDSPPISRHNSERTGKLYGETDPYTVRYPQVHSSPRIDKHDIKYSQHARRASADDTDRDYVPYSNHREALRSPRMGRV